MRGNWIVKDWTPHQDAGVESFRRFPGSSTGKSQFPPPPTYFYDRLYYRKVPPEFEASTRRQVHENGLCEHWANPAVRWLRGDRARLSYEDLQPIESDASR